MLSSCTRACVALSLLVGISGSPSAANDLIPPQSPANHTASGHTATARLLSHLSEQVRRSTPKPVVAEVSHDDTVPTSHAVVRQADSQIVLPDGFQIPGTNVPRGVELRNPPEAHADRAADTRVALDASIADNVPLADIPLADIEPNEVPVPDGNSASMLPGFTPLLHLSPSNQPAFGSLTATEADDPAMGAADMLCESCDVFCPTWSAQAGIVFLHRHSSDDTVMFEGTGVANITGEDFDFDFEPGIELSLTRDINCTQTLELRYFAIDDWDATLSRTGTFTVRQNPTATGLDFDGRYASELHSVEMNLVSEDACRCLTWLHGFRYVGLNEQITAIATGGTAYSTSTSNSMYGYQLGASRCYPCLCQPWDVRASFRAGVFYNHATHVSTRGTDRVRDAQDSVAFLTEAGLTATYAISCNASLWAGYRAMWASEVAIASDQFTVTDFALGGIDTTGDAVYQGLMIGLQLVR